MDIGTVMKKLKLKEYERYVDCVADIRQTWRNALIYNAPGSKIYINAKLLSDVWEGLWKNYMPNDLNRPPSSEEMHQWIENCYRFFLVCVFNFISLHLHLTLQNYADRSWKFIKAA